ncbi:MAG: tetratricopeptide repeat protein [Candidatus Melainabacteria bacterium]
MPTPALFRSTALLLTTGVLSGLLLSGCAQSTDTSGLGNQSSGETTTATAPEAATSETAAETPPAAAGEASPAKAPNAQEKAQAQNLYTEGMVAVKQQQWDAAIPKLREAVSLDPYHVAANSALGWSLAEKHNWDEASKYLHEAIRLDPKLADAHNNLAWVYAEKQQWNLSIQEAKQATTLNPGNPYAFSTLGWGLKATNQREAAIDAYKKAVSLKPDMADAYFSIAMLTCDGGDTTGAQAQVAGLTRLDAGLAQKVKARVSKGCP